MNAPIGGLGDYQLNEVREPLRESPPIVTRGDATERLSGGVPRSD